MVCAKCYAERQLNKWSNMQPCLKRNAEILTTKVLDTMPILNAAYFRFESFGDLINETQVINYFNICKANKQTKFALWTKNPEIVKRAIEAGAKKPRNLQIVYSSPYLNKVDDVSYDFVDKIFTVFDKGTIAKCGVDVNCGARNCLKCHKCYVKGSTRYINEKLKLR